MAPKKPGTAAAGLIFLLVVVAYGNIVFGGRSLNPVLLIPDHNRTPRETRDWDTPAGDELKLSTGYRDIRGTDLDKRDWHVDLANPAYLEWPVNVFVGKALKAGHIPLVLPYQNLGVPLIGQYCHRVLSPYQMLEDLFLPRGYDFFLILRLILAGIFTYGFLRPLCRRTAAALTGAVGYGLGGIMVVYSNHEEVTNVAMMLPLLMWAARAFFDRPGAGRAAGLALALALVHTAGQPEIQLYVLFLALLYGSVRLGGLPGEKRVRAAAWALGAALASAAIAAPQIYLFLQFHREAWSFHPPGGNMGLQSPIQVNKLYFSFFPQFRQSPWAWSYRTVNLTWDWVGGYFGLGLLFLAAANLRKGGRKREATLFGGYFLFILAKNLGWSPAQLLGLLPGFDQTWSPRWAAPTWSFALAVLAGLGLDNLLDRNLPAETAQTVPTVSCPRAIVWLRNRPVSAAGLLFVSLGLACLFSRLGSAWWEAQRMRPYVFFNGLSFFLWGAAGLAGATLLPRRGRRYLLDVSRTVRESLRRNQAGTAAFLAALGTVALRALPAKHYLFTGSEPPGTYLLAVPAFLASLAGLFFILASAAHPSAAALAAVAVPAVLLGGLAHDPLEPAAPVFKLVFGAACLALAAAPAFPRLKRIFFPTLSFLLLAALIVLGLTGNFFDSPARNDLLRLHASIAFAILGFYSFLGRATDRNPAVPGWIFLFPVWAELAVYIPKNHFGDGFFFDVLPFLIAGGVAGAGAFFSRRRRLSFPGQVGATVLTLLLCGGTLVAIDRFSPSHLPPRCSPQEPMPFVEFLRVRQPAAAVGIGRVLVPNFASAQELVDLRGCVSMNTASYQFFLGDVLGVVPPDSSYSLWFTGENPIDTAAANPYQNSSLAQREALENALPYYRLAAARYLLSPLGLLDPVGARNPGIMRRIYRWEVDIWEIPALPPVFIAHRAEITSMMGRTDAWKKAVKERPEILRGELVLLEEPPPEPVPESSAAPTDRAEIVSTPDPNLIRVRFRSEKPGYLVVNRAYTNLLRAYLEDRELPVLKANGPFTAVPVPGDPNERELLLTYVSPPTRAVFWAGGIALLATLAVPAAAAITKAARSRRRASDEFS